MTSYYSEQELQNYISVKDKDLNTLFQELRKLIPDRYYLRESSVTLKNFFRVKKKELTFYSLLFRYGNDNDFECQNINFEVTGSKSSINISVEKSYIMSMFYGLINGYSHAINKNKQKVNIKQYLHKNIKQEKELKRNIYENIIVE